MDDEKLNIFIKIKETEEVKNILNSLNKDKYEISAKLPSSSEDIIQLVATSLLRTELSCQIKNKPTHMSIPEKGSLVIQVQMGDEKILAQPKYLIRDEQIYLQMDCDFYQLQRREDFRLRIPSSFHSEILITNKNDQNVKYKGSLADISSGGCRYENHRKLFPIASNDTIKGTITFSGRPSVEISGVIRHIAPLPDNPEADLVGIQFQDLSAQSKNRIFALIMDIHRELFTKLR